MISMMNLKWFSSQVKKIFSQYSEVKLVYLFGSQARGDFGLLSDYDLAVYFDEKTPSIKRSEIKIKLIVGLMGKLKTNKIDIVCLNDDLQPLLKYQIIHDGKLIYEKKPYRLILEAKIYSEYFDFQIFSRLNDL